MDDDQVLEFMEKDGRCANCVFFAPSFLFSMHSSRIEGDCTIRRRTVLTDESCERWRYRRIPEKSQY